MSDLPAVTAPCHKCGQRPQARGTGWCARCLDAEDERRQHAGSARRSPRPPTRTLAPVHVCEWCGAVLDGYASRRTCSPAHRKALSRAGGMGAFSGPDVTASGKGGTRHRVAPPEPAAGAGAPVTAPEAMSAERRRRKREKVS